MTSLTDWVCLRCKYYSTHNKCVAFPSGIPASISSGENDHSKPVEGDRGITFEEIEKDAEGYYK
jgi:hypothetical protein